jgi:hypothetical protein
MNTAPLNHPSATQGIHALVSIPVVHAAKPSPFPELVFAENFLTANIAVAASVLKLALNPAMKFRKFYGYIFANFTNVALDGQFACQVNCSLRNKLHTTLPLTVLNFAGVSAFASSVPTLPAGGGVTAQDSLILNIPINPSGNTEVTPVLLQPFVFQDEIDLITLDILTVTNVSYAHLWLGCYSY